MYVYKNSTMGKKLIIVMSIVFAFIAFIFLNNEFKNLGIINSNIPIITDRIVDNNNGLEEVGVSKSKVEIKHLKSHPLSDTARSLIGKVTSYDTSYYQGAYPPDDRGACTDLVERALRENGYKLKDLIDEDMRNNPELYPHEPDPNINFRRVRNVKIFLDRHAQKVSTCISRVCFKDNIWQAGDIVTYNQIPGGLWHIAIISNKVKTDGDITIPYLIHNHGSGAVEDDLLLLWPAAISGHYRIL